MVMVMVMKQAQALAAVLLNMITAEGFIERLRPLVGIKSGWDYAVVWKLCDQEHRRYIEFMACCCAGAENNYQHIAGGGGDFFPVCCRDVAFQHSASKPACQLVAQLPFSIPLDYGIHGQTLLSNQPKWLNFSSSSSDPTTSESEDTVGTKVLIPVPGGLIELFVSKQVSQDQDVIDFIIAQCSICLEQAALLIHNSSNMDDDTNYNNPNDHVVELLLQKPYTVHEDEGGDHKHPNNNYNNFQPPVSPSVVLESLNQNQVPHDISVDRIEICNHPMNFLPQAKCGSENRRRNDLSFDDGSNDTFISDNNLMEPFNSTVKDSEFQDMDSVMANTSSSTVHVQEDIQHFLKSDHQQQGNEKSSVKQETGRSGSISDCIDQIDDGDDAKHRGRNGKGAQCKNLVAERKRRKKLNDRLYNLRTLVPNISKLDRASILGDAIEYAKELQKQVKELQDELEEHSDTEAVKHNNNVQSDIHLLNHNRGASENGGTSSPIHNQDSDITSDNKLQQQMEPQVEVIQIGGGNELLVKVFWEHKTGGFVRLLEALNSIGLEVTNINVTRFITLVSNVFHVEKRRDSQLVEADEVRESLLEITRNSSSARWSKKQAEMGSGIDNGMEDQPQNHHHHQALHNMHVNSFNRLQHLYNQS